MCLKKGPREDSCHFAHIFHCNSCCVCAVMVECGENYGVQLQVNQQVGVTLEVTV